MCQNVSYAFGKFEEKRYSRPLQMRFLLVIVGSKSGAGGSPPVREGDHLQQSESSTRLARAPKSK